MNEFPRLSELYFGDLEAYDEARLHKAFFDATFVQPASMSPDQLRNNNKFIVVGRKGAGKTAIQMHLANALSEKEGYLTQFFRFLDDMKPDDYNEMTRTQSHISFVEAIDEKKIFISYDYRPAWIRILLHKLAVMFIQEGFESPFTQYIAPKGSVIKSVFQGIAKSLKVEATADIIGIAATVGFDFSEYGESKKLPLEEFNHAAIELFKTHCYRYQVYFFIDELVFSRLDATDDEIKVRAAMVRDIIRAARDLNTLSALNDIDIHFICSLRPEVRNLLNDLDSEIGKVIDGRDVSLVWLARADQEDTLLDQVFENKIRNSYYKKIDVNKFVLDRIRFGSRHISIGEFLKTNTWGRPRDVVRLLQAIAKASPNSRRIGDSELKAGLDEYSRASLKELVDELGVVFGRKMIDALKKGITRRTYDNDDSLWNAIGPYLQGLSKDSVINELFELGVIQGYLSNPPRYFAAHRGENYLKTQHKIRIHPALWNELGIRSL